MAERKHFWDPEKWEPIDVPFDISDVPGLSYRTHAGFLRGFEEASEEDPRTHYGFLRGFKGPGDDE